MRILDIPSEIVYEICSYLDRRTISECRTLCKSWKTPTCRLMYKGVVIDAFRVYYTKLILKRPPQERYGYFQYGVTITRLTLAADYKEMVHVFNSKRSKATQLRSSDIEFSKKEIITLLEALPNLEYLNMNASMNLQKYLNCILKTDSKKCLTRIQHIPPSNKTLLNFDSADRYFSVCYKYRATIDSLRLLYHYDMPKFAPLRDHLLVFIGRFTRLTRLRVDDCSSVYTISTVDIEVACPSLKELRFFVGPDWELANVQSSLEVTNSHGNSNLHTMCLGCPVMGPSYLKYIIEHTPLVTTFSFTMYWPDICSWIAYIGLDTTKKFFCRLSVANNATFSYYQDNSSDWLRPEKITMFFKVVNAFRGYKNPFCSATFNYNLKPKGESFMTYDSEKGLELIFDAPQWTSRDSLRLPDTRISGIGLEIINVLKVFLRFDSDEANLLRMLTIALERCPLLVTTRFVDEKSKGRMLYMGPYFHTNRFEDAQLFTSRINVKKNLRMMTAQNFIPSTKTLRLLANHLPNIKNVAFIHIPLQYEKRVVNLLQFKNLETFFLDLGPHRRIEAEYAYICLQCNDGDNLYYCYKEEYPFQLTVTSKEFIKQCHWRQPKRIFNMVIKCCKKVKLVFGRYNYGLNGVYSSVLFAELKNGKLLDHISLDSRMFCHDIYLK